MKVRAALLLEVPGRAAHPAVTWLPFAPLGLKGWMQHLD